MVILQMEASRGFGGQEEWVLRLTTALAKRGHRIGISCYPNSPVSRKTEDMGLLQWPLRIRNSLDPKAILGLLRIIRRKGIEVIHTHDAKTTWTAYFASRLSLRRPVLVRTRHLIHHSKYAFPYTFLSDRVVPVSQHLRNYLVEDLGVSPSKVVVISPGVDTDLFNAETTDPTVRKEFGIPRGVPVIGTVAFLRDEKGHRFLVEAARTVLQRHADTYFLFVGSGSKTQEGVLRGMITQRGMEDHFVFTGYRTDIPRLLAAMDIFVLPSIREAMGISIVEAMAMKKPVIASRTGGIPEVLVNEETGLLVPPGDPVALADAILFLLSHPTLGQKWGENGRQRVEKGYSLESACNQTVALYRNLLEEIHCGIS